MSDPFSENDLEQLVLLETGGSIARMLAQQLLAYHRSAPATRDHEALRGLVARAREHIGQLEQQVSTLRERLEASTRARDAAASDLIRLELRAARLERQLLAERRSRSRSAVEVQPRPAAPRPRPQLAQRERARRVTGPRGVRRDAPPGDPRRSVKTKK